MYQGERIIISHAILNMFGLRAQKCHRYDKAVIDIFITTYISSYLNIYPIIDEARSRMLTTRYFYLHSSFFLHLKISIYIISQISIIRKKIRAYQLKLYATTCFQILIWIILSYFFGYVLGLYFVSSSM